MNTDIGYIPVVAFSQKMKRQTTLYYASKSIGNYTSSIFFIIRPKDVVKLEGIGYVVQSIVVPSGNSPRALNYGNHTVLEYSPY
jgi:hypothetical protein